MREWREWEVRGLKLWVAEERVEGERDERGLSDVKEKCMTGEVKGHKCKDTKILNRIKGLM